MARLHVLLGPYDSRVEAADTATAVAHDGYSNPRVVKLRDRTGPSVAERPRLAEARVILMGARMAQFEGHPAEGGAGIVERLSALEADLLDLRTRVGDLEREPTASPPATTVPTPEQIEAYLRGSAEWAQHPSVDRLWDHERSGGSIDITDPGLIKSLCAVESRTPAEMRARIIGVSTADPDRLAMRAAKGAK